MLAPDVVRDSFLPRIYDINDEGFEGVAVDLFLYQYSNNPLYRQYCDMVGCRPEQVSLLEHIPFLPIVFFRDHMVKTGVWTEQTIFRSSGTTDAVASRHFVRDILLYHQVATRCFSSIFGSPTEFVWIGLLPSYLERPDSSLVNMVQAFARAGQPVDTHFYKTGDEELLGLLSHLKADATKTILVGVSFALLDFFEAYDVPFWNQLMVMETGGMKGKGKEITRDELYDRITQQHAGLHLVSEYGMTEMFSQAYRQRDRFVPGPTMRVLVRDISDPFSIIGHGRRGGLNIVDLGNIDTCAFIATDDAGILYADGGFDVLGRLDASDMRGCNLMYTS